MALCTLAAVVVLRASDGQAPLPAAIAAPIPIAFGAAPAPRGLCRKHQSTKITGVNFLAEEVAGERSELLRHISASHTGRKIGKPATAA